MGSTNPEKRFYTPKDLIEMGYGSRSTVYRDLDSGKIPHHRPGGRILIPKDEFDLFMMRERVERESAGTSWRAERAVSEIVSVASRLTAEQREAVLAALV